MEDHTQCNGSQLHSYETEFKPKMVTRDRDGHTVMIKGTIHQEDTIIINMHTPSTGVPTYTKNYIKNIF